jgi:hypothetical protein
MKRFVLTAFLVTVAGGAHAELTSAEKAMLDRINSDPELRTEALARLSRNTATNDRKAATAPRERTAPELGGPIAESKDEPIAYSPQQSPCAGFQFLLRQDWKDFDLLACPGATKDATGAQVSFTNDLASGNRIWAINGTAAIVYNSLMTPSVWWQPTYLNFGAYGSLDRSFNSATAFTASDVDKAAYGAFLQVGYLSDYLQNFLRVRGGIVENHIKNTTAANFIAEYIPVYDLLYIHYPTDPILGVFRLRFDPTLFVQYSEVTGKDQVLAVNNRMEALRAGAQATLRLLPDLGAGKLAPLRVVVTYRWATEAYTGRNLSWFQSDVTYNLDPDGYVSVGFTYQRGNDEDTGAFTNVYQAGLRGKL